MWDRLGTEASVRAQPNAKRQAMIRLSLFQKAALAVIVILLPIFITFLITYQLNKKQIKQGILEDLTLIAAGYETQIYQFLEMSKRRAMDFSSDGFIRDHLKNISRGQTSAVEPLNRHLIRNKMPLDKAIQAIYVISLNNRVAASTDRFSVGKYTSITHFLKDRKTGQTVIESGAGFTGLPELEISAPITDRKTGELIGIIVNTVQLSELNKIMSGDFAAELGASRHAKPERSFRENYLVNKDKLMLTESKFVKDAILNRIVDTPPVKNCLESNTGTTSSYEDYNGIRVIGVSMCIPSLKWVLLVTVAEDEALTPLAQIQKGAVVSGVIVAGLIVILFAFYIRKVVAPIRIMSRAAGDIAGGNYRVSVPVRSHDELGELSNSFNKMAGDIEFKTSEIKKLAFALEQSINIVFITDIKGNIEYVNPMFEKITGWPKEEVIGKNPRILASGETTKAQYEEMWATILSGKAYRYTFKNKKKNGQYYWALAQTVPIKNERGEIVQFLAMQEDITEKKEAEERVEYLTAYDELTGLYNRVRFMELMDNWIKGAKDSGRRIALFLIDIDEFRSLNEIYGHSIGDEFLRRIADLLKNTMEDIHGKSALAHLGGDEFAVFITDINEREALEIAEIIRRRVEGLYFTPVTTRLTASIGIVFYPEHAAMVRELLSRADIAMYRAKASGRNRCHIYQPEDHDMEKIHSRLKEKERIQKAIEEGRFEPWFQPILCLEDNKIRHYEALARMRGEDGEILLPGAFIDTAEIFGLIGAIDMVIIEKTMQLQAEMSRKGRHLSFSVNLSGKDLGDQEILSFLRDKIAESGAEPGRLIFEITETAAIHDMDKAVKFIKALKAIGCHFSLDDFGVGFTSFIYLREMGVDFIKIDGSFIKRLHEDERDRLFVKAIVDVAKGMGIKTIAEFVENEEILKLLKKIGVDYAQGFFIGKPAPWNEIKSED